MDTRLVQGWARGSGDLERAVAVIGRGGAARGPTAWQYAGAAAILTGGGATLHWAPQPAATALSVTFAALFSLAVWMRPLAAAVSTLSVPATPPASDADCPAYTVIVPLYHEAGMVPQLLAALDAIDYPRARLQVLLALEEDDIATRVAVRRAGPPAWVAVVTTPQGAPRTKPAACNAALARATGELVVVFDAEDRPHPLQLREAAARFAAADLRLACLQAPLRVCPGRGWLARQFALEYALLFEVMLPAFARLGLGFPLGGTSNHFRAVALRQVGGWDAFNVTEDADIGLRLARAGLRLGMLSRPTREAAPDSLSVWTPQRTRWIKGHMQTWGVHMRRPLAGRWRAAAGLHLMLGLNILSSLLHGPLMLGVAASFAVAWAARQPPGLSRLDLALLIGGWLLTVLTTALAIRRAGGAYRIRDAFGALVYWPLQSLAGAFAIWQLAAAPHRWEKTPHEPIGETWPLDVRDAA